MKVVADVNVLSNSGEPKGTPAPAATEEVGAGLRNLRSGSCRSDVDTVCDLHLTDASLISIPRPARAVRPSTFVYKELLCRQVAVFLSTLADGWSRYTKPLQDVMDRLIVE